MRNLFYLFILPAFVLSLIAGCSSTSDVIEESPPPQASSESVVEPAEPVQQAKEELRNIFYFDYDDATVRPDTRPIIEAHAERLKNSNQAIVIEGYADERGTEAYNRELGQRRAEAVKDLLVSMGVQSSQIETISYGEQNPQDSGNNELAWQKNRRVELK